VAIFKQSSRRGAIAQKKLRTTGIDSRSRVEEGVAFVSCRINRSRFADVLVLLASSQQHLQHVLDRFSAACDRARMKIRTKNTEVLCPCTKAVYAASERSALQQVEKLKWIEVVFTSDGRWSEEADA